MCVLIAKTGYIMYQIEKGLGLAVAAFAFLPPSRVRHNEWMLNV